jgi:hypothetical protein
MLIRSPKCHPELAIHTQINQETVGGLSQVRHNVQQKQWDWQGNQSIKVAAEAICKDGGTKKAFFEACTGSSIPVSV